MGKKRQILVIGNNTNGCTPKHEKFAYDIGKEIAKSNSVLITGGLGGVMIAASRGSHDANGLSIGIIPQDDANMANEFCDVVIPTGMGFTRDFLNALSADDVIIIGGGSVESYIDGFLDHRENVKIIGCDTAQDVVKKILELITA